MDWHYFLSEIAAHRTMLLHGAAATIMISLLAIVAGTLLGVVIGVAVTYGVRAVRWPARAYIDIIRGTPVLVLILATFYVSSAVGLDLSAFQAGALALTLFCASHVGEILRGALQSLPRGQIEAGQAIGLTFTGIFRYVLFPQALRYALPTWITAAVEMVKASTLLSVIGVTELLLTTQQIISNNFLNMQFYLLAGVIYFLIDFAIERVGRHIGRRLDQPTRRTT
ncbi:MULTISPECIES: amino acid ABC transporter permease [unclassified Modicisalibacter]|uniref:amino acid ABC transporter permease n=1 Tax=unclassified Modicisalibacter TaxID=2679913 RepID=UPI001CCFB042|nr:MULTISPECIES: amino acid ABC transporter permease [unclassified Modicisalibacter]MBZ9558470.1 amino acid ABC transporter permease [Modicisalibacter sp. R2A 31.J]MBZ9575638.1 amino acid ABC transporter permease [Modicisalibacter sp. MOD 31.J]